ncbi:dTDP-4-dehydrorhamnose 3,5-epimerase family protein [Parafrankia sp. FMc2]|uniref:dTDP-4-dehydrorhamnose 3,5-epimerase family protein n=1 Tax=Parafrankia sp. FMc2 TaxID=3233196 RepID=UPI0034D411FA
MGVATTEFSVRKTEIPGLLVFDITSMADERGWFQEKFHRAKLVAAGLPESFEVVQTSVSFNRSAGVTRGFHAEPWDKYISVVAGRVFCAYLDLRAGGNFGRVVTVEIDQNCAVFLPRGVANSFQTLEDDTYYIYSVNRHWSAEEYDDYVFVNLADPALGVRWPIPLDEAVISERDRNHAALADVRPFDEVPA